MESYNLTEAKAKLSAIISRVAFARKNVTIRRKGKNVAVVVPYEEYLHKWAGSAGGKGLLSAKGALANIVDIDEFVEDIYKAREESVDRNETGV
ncbi:MAG: type II toxin-antitoxin system Phd/YefM family antitoxin [Deltaproteobacteria bacterium]|nr:type II toxin-antitoxin system Phd/YefM family antitoxin [Deltaproteobacteria bacterium]MBW2317633.1 type II toxin-antitoxin system Phd/YefM family antitoxin [Deltaproteobacteria bacterium]